MTEADQDQPCTSKEIEKKTSKRGIIYLSTIPPYMNVTKIREIFGEFGKLGRVYLQLNDKVTKEGEKKSKKRKVAKKFTEGWVEYDKKIVAKRVARLLNNTQVSTRKSSKHYDYLWNIKYLSAFKWIHLHERLAYEKAARRQKLRVETELAKKKTNFFTSNLNKNKNNKTYINKELENIDMSINDVEVDDNGGQTEEREEFLKSLFT